MSTLTRSGALLAACALLACQASVHAAEAAPAPAWGVSGNVTLLSDYLFRGVSQTQGKATAQASVDFSHASGAYLGVFGSGVSNAAYNNGSGAEIDLYGGYRYALGKDSNVDAGLVTYWYPAARFRAGGRSINYDTQDAKLGLNVGSFNAYAWLTLSKNWFGYAVDPYSGDIVDSRGSTYVEANWNPELTPGWTLNLHAGHQRVRKLGAYNFADVKVGVTTTWDSWTFSAAAVYNNGDDKKNGQPLWTFFNMDGSGKNVVGKRIQVSAARNF
ncbi:TorF family putative porin [Janthinobacterium fluminis]|uniref:TorF family putative porin n=1 Tax=Janthinobacterium fluminis TaxID=2987524 RepID=A0ABT5JVT2_9BURK|nr:TorF family putative porin [Janthinobacterium fluminis]MDC8756828.1 TorF family putative porin [Janthinobacterium fluminis]